MGFDYEEAKAIMHNLKQQRQNSNLMKQQSKTSEYLKKAASKGTTAAMLLYTSDENSAIQQKQSPYQPPTANFFEELGHPRRDSENFNEDKSVDDD